MPGTRRAPDVPIQRIHPGGWVIEVVATGPTDEHVALHVEDASARGVAQLARVCIDGLLSHLGDATLWRSDVARIPDE